MTTRSPILSLRGVQKSYGPIKVLHGVDLDIYPGKSWRCSVKTVPGNRPCRTSFPAPFNRPRAK